MRKGSRNQDGDRVESPPYFRAATETACDIATTYIETGIGTRPNHKFEHYTRGAEACDTLPAVADANNVFRYALELYVDVFISIVIPTAQEQLHHAVTAIMDGILTSSHQTKTTLMTPYQRRSYSNGTVNMMFSRHFWVLNLMVLEKHNGWRQQSGKSSSPLFIRESGWHRAGMGAYCSSRLR